MWECVCKTIWDGFKVTKMIKSFDCSNDLFMTVWLNHLHIPDISYF